MDKELRAFFGRAKNISLLPQEREGLKGAIFTERKGTPARHTSRMQQLHPALMSTASTISLSAREKRKTHRELQSFMRAHPVLETERAFSPWSFPRMIPLYAPVLVVVLIILANTQQWGEKALAPQSIDESGTEMEDAVSVPIAPLFMKFPQEGEGDGQEVLQDEAGQESLEMVSPPPQGEVRRKVEPQREPEVLPVRQEMDGFVAPAVREEPAEDQAAGGEGAPATMMQIRPSQNGEPTETNAAPATGSAEMRYQPAVQKSQTESAPGTALQGILTVAEARLQSLRQKSLESEEATALFRQAEQKLNNARAFSEKEEERALRSLQEAEKLMDALEALGST